jgi:hypothetical protein
MTQTTKHKTKVSHITYSATVTDEQIYQPHTLVGGIIIKPESKS